MDINTVFAKVYLTTQTTLRTLIKDLLKSLRDFGCHSWSERELFTISICKVMLKLATCEPDAAPLATFDLPGLSVHQKRVALIKEILIGFGASNDAATSLANIGANLDTEIVARLTKNGGLSVRPPKGFSLLRMRICHLHGDAMKMYGRLEEALEKTREPYRGTPLDPDAGVEQVVALMQLFPDLADALYRKLGFRSTASFPPQATGVAGKAERIFVKAATAQVEYEWWWNTIKVAGLVIASITITLISAGTLGPVAATFVGSGIGLSQGVAAVVDSRNKLQHTQDAHRYGAATKESVVHAEGEVQGAWGMLIVDTATGGLLGRFGGGPLISNATKTLRVTVISGVGNGIATATNPNVWRSRDASGLIIFATVIGGATGAAGQFVSAGIARVLPGVGDKVQIGVSKVHGHLAQNKVVAIQLRPTDPPVDAKVVSINTADSTAVLKVEGSNLHVRVGEVVEIGGSLFRGKDLQEGLVPMAEADFNNLFTRAYRIKPGAEPELGMVDRSSGHITFTTELGTQSKVKLEDLRVFKKNPGNIPPKDREVFDLQKNDYDIAPIKRHKNYYTAVRRTDHCNTTPKLRIIPGHKVDGNPTTAEGAFSGWANEELPKFEMRGRHALKPTPTPDEVAVFMAHGYESGFTNMETREAARTMVDAIIETNRKSNSAKSIRYCALSSCLQGNRRYIVTGKTNAEVFQQHVDMRLRELGVNPKSSRGITVLASDRMGSLIGPDLIAPKRSRHKRVNVAGPEHHGRTTFVPAGTQRPLSYPRDLALVELKTVGLVLRNAGTKAMMIVAASDPNAFMDALERFSDYIFGVIVDGPPTLEVAPSNFQSAGHNY